MKPASFYAVALRIFSRDYLGTRLKRESERERASQVLPDQPPPVVATEQSEESFPLKSYAIITSRSDILRRSYGFQDAQRAGRRQNALQAQASASKELLEIIP